MPRKTVKVLNTVYCSSSGDYYGRVSIISANGKRNLRDFDLQSGKLLRKDDPSEYKSVPQYVLDEIKACYRQMLEGNTLSVYEINQDGGRRYEDHRYHDSARLRHLIERM